jgi:hypothetical protein
MGVRLAEPTLRSMALGALRGVGDAGLGQWLEMGETAFHVRRRLTADEQAKVGDVVDVRGTPEADRRRRPVAGLVPPGWIE